MNNEIYVLSKENQTIIDGEMVVNNSEKIYIFENFETELLNLFDGATNTENIVTKLNNKYGNTFKKDEFFEFVKEMVDKGVLKKVD